MIEPRRISMDDDGIGTILSRFSLFVPPNQREYSWTEKEVGDLFNDLQTAIDGNEPTYFLGAIALTGVNPSAPGVSDGQQRLATTVILLSAMRDYFLEKGDEWNAKWVYQTFTTTPLPDEQRDVSRIQLNVDDREFFNKQIASSPGDAARNAPAQRRSHERILSAIALASDRVKMITDPYNKVPDKIKRLRHWIEYIRDSAIVIALRLPNDQNAFKIFETLNDRGLKTTQVDILKNFLFQEAMDKHGNVGDVQPKWSRMLGIIESIDGEDVEINFLRHFVITKFGMTRSGEVYGKIEQKVSGRHQASEFITELESNAGDYAAIVSPDHRKWNDYSLSVRNSVRTIKHLKVIHTRPLMLAIARQFRPKEAEKAFRLLVNWTVRFMIVGGGRSETLEKGYAEAANAITNKAITDARTLAAKLLPIIPPDSTFEEAFTIADVPKTVMARYYLRALETQIQGKTEPEWVPNEDALDVNLEHILPVNPGGNWPSIPQELADALYTRLGNMVLLQATPNRNIGNADFETKKKVFAKSSFVLTAQVANYFKWDAEEIRARQAKLAELAVKTWPREPK